MNEQKSREELQAKYDKLLKRVTKLEDEMQGSQDVSFDLASRMEKAADRYRKVQRDFIAEGHGFFDKFTATGEYNEAFENIAKFGEKFFGDSRQALEPMKNLAVEMGNFITFSQKGQQQLGEMAATFEKLGLRAKTLGGVLDSASRAFGQNEEQLRKLSVSLVSMSQDLLMRPEQLAQNFSAAQKTLAYDSDKLMTVFSKLQVTSRATGLSFGTLTSKFGETMDTFQGSANVAGKLNAILGRSVFNTMDLLGKTESERIETIVSGLTSNLGTDLSNLGKFELKAIAGTLGLNPEEMRRLLKGGGNIKEVLQKRGGDQLLQDRAKTQKDVNLELNKFQSQIENSRNALFQFKIELQAGMLDLFEKDVAPKLHHQVASLWRLTSDQFKNLGPVLVRELRDRAQTMSGDEIKAMKEVIRGGNRAKIIDALRKGSTDVGGLDDARKRNSLAEMLLRALIGTGARTGGEAGEGGVSIERFKALETILRSGMGNIKKIQLLNMMAQEGTTVEDLNIEGAGGPATGALDAKLFALAKKKGLLVKGARTEGKRFFGADSASLFKQIEGQTVEDSRLEVTRSFARPAGGPEPPDTAGSRRVVLAKASINDQAAAIGGAVRSAFNGATLQVDFDAKTAKVIKQLRNKPERPER